MFQRTCAQAPRTSQLASPPTPPQYTSPELAPSSMLAERRPSNLAKHESQTLPLDLGLINDARSDGGSSIYSDDVRHATDKKISILQQRARNGSASPQQHASGLDNSLPIRPKTAEPHPRQLLFELDPVRRRTSLGPIEQSPVTPTTSGFPSVVRLPSKLMEHFTPSVTELDEKGAAIRTGPLSTMDWPSPRKKCRRVLLIALICVTLLVVLGLALGTYFGLRYNSRT